MTTLTQRQIPGAITRREEFQGSNISGEWEDPGHWIRTGRLPGDEAQILQNVQRDAHRFGEKVYVVYSYGTPIAWGLENRELYVPDAHYSVTTSRHQSLVRRAR